MNGNKSYMLKLVIACIMLAINSPYAAAAEDNDTITSITDSITKEIYKTDSAIVNMTAAKDSAAIKKVKRNWATWAPNPKRALWLALVLPGAGQIYNRKYWKLPIVYGGFVGCIYAMRWNNQMYRDYSQAYMDLMDNDPNT